MFQGTENISILVAFTAGFLSIASPCVLALIPSYLSFITGLTVDQITAGGRWGGGRRAILLPAIVFVIGFSLVFVLMGASATALGNAFFSRTPLITKAGGALVMLLGLHLSGLINFGFLQRERRFHLTGRPAGLIGAGLVGVTFAAGWTPCIGPILGGILIYASTATKVTSGVLLLAVYSLGLGVPFLAAALAMNRFLNLFQRFKMHLRAVSVVSGLFLMAVGALIFSGYFAWLTGYLNSVILPIFPFLAQ